MYGIVYLIIDGTNDLGYVGQTRCSLGKRFNQHAKNNSYIGNAIRAHGAENFVAVVLKKCASKEELDFWEKHFIKSRHSKCPYGYNLTDGGEGTVGLERTPEWCAKISEARKGKPLPPEHYAKLSIMNKGDKNPFFGKNHTNAARKKMAVIHRKETPYKNLLAEMNKQQLLYNALAELLGISISTLSSKVHGNRNFTAKDISKLVEIFEMPVEYLLKRNDGSELEMSNRGKTPYKNLSNEINKRDLTFTVLAELLGISIASLSMKIHCKQKFTARDKKKARRNFRQAYRVFA